MNIELPSVAAANPPDVVEMLEDHCDRVILWVEFRA